MSLFLSEVSKKSLKIYRRKPSVSINVSRLLLSGGILSFLTLGGCSSSTGNSGDSSRIIADSLRLDSIEKAKEEAALTALPDTAYPSVSNVKVSVEIADSSTGEIDSLRDLYADAPGAFTFRKGQYRDADFGGTLDTVPSRLNIDWEFTTREDYTPTKHGTWGGGTGWTGQPLYVEWPDSVMQRFKAASLPVAKREIMVGSLCGDVYFIDYVSGKATRPAVNTGNPIKGTISLDPGLNGNLYVGQGVAADLPARALTIDLYRNSITHQAGVDPKAPRGWNAFDSSPVRVGQFLFRPGENGVLYKYLVAPGNLTLHSAARYTAGGSGPGMEASMSVYLNYGYTADNRGNIICWNLNNLKPVWHYKLPDDTDCTPMICKEEGHPYLYVGCEVEHAGVSKANYVKLDALSGKCLWVNETPAQRHDSGEKHFDGGFYATSLPGSADCKDLIFANVVANTSGQNGSFVAIDRATGTTRYSIPLRYYAWSSPVGFTTKKGEFIVVTFDCSGNGYIINGRTGDIISRQAIGANFESSPVVVGNTLVIGSRGARIYRLSLR